MNALKSQPFHQQGYTLPELLIGMTLGLLVIAAATAAYGTSKQTWNAMAAADAVHANARVALRNIREQAQMSGAACVALAVDSIERMPVPEGDALNVFGAVHTCQRGLSDVLGRRNFYVEVDRIGVRLITCVVTAGAQKRSPCHVRLFANVA